MNRIIADFHRLYYDSKVWLQNTTWMGVPILKLPFDLFLFQEIIYETKPDLIVECGTYNGGSALFFASMMDLINNGHVLTIDTISRPNMPKHPRITYFKGSSTSQEALDKVKSMIRPNSKVMVILDSDHTKAHVLNEIRLYKDFVSKGSYLVVEDTNINGHPVRTGWGPGPMEAVQEFMGNNREFIIDTSKHKFFVTFQPNGFLKKL